MARLQKISVFLHKPIFEKVFDIATYSKLKKEDRMAYDLAQKNRWDQFSIKETAFNDGKSEGKLEGVRDIIKNLYQNGLPIDQIATLTMLSTEQISQFLEE